MLGTRIYKELRKNWQLYVLSLLPFIYIFIFAYVPMYGVLIAFKRFDPSMGILGSKWVGMYYFKRFFDSPWFARTFMNTLRLSVYSMVMTFPFPIILALCLNVMVNRTLKKSVQMVTYLPFFISTIVIVNMIVLILNPRIGMIGKWLLAMSGGKINNVMADPNAFRHIYVWSDVWQGTGWSSIIYIAALSGVSSEQTEAAIIDGTTRLQRVWYIDIPAIMPTIVITLIMRVGGLVNVGFEKALLLQNDLNLATSEVIPTYSYKVGLLMGSGDFSFGSAIGLFNSVINLVLLVAVNAVSKRVSETSLW